MAFGWGGGRRTFTRSLTTDPALRRGRSSCKHENRSVCGIFRTHLLLMDCTVDWRCVFQSLCTLVLLVSPCSGDTRLQCQCLLPEVATNQSVQLDCTKSQLQGASSTIWCSQRVVRRVPPGYRHVDDFGVYRFGRTGATWTEARQRCALDGGHLAIPNTQAEADAFRKVIREHPGVQAAWVGISDLRREGSFETVHDSPISSLDALAWGKNQPINAVGDEDCVHQSASGVFASAKCLYKRPYLCELPEVSVPTGYTLIEEHGFYKVYYEPRSYQQAVKVCQNDGAHLAVPETEYEAEILATLLEPRKDKEAFYIGINDLKREGQFVTELGEELTTSSFQNWAVGEPSNTNKNEHCVTVWHWALSWNDDSCQSLHPFVCERPL